MRVPSRWHDIKINRSCVDLLTRSCLNKLSDLVSNSGNRSGHFEKLSQARYWSLRYGKKGRLILTAQELPTGHRSLIVIGILPKHEYDKFYYKKSCELEVYLSCDDNFKLLGEVTETGELILPETLDADPTESTEDALGDLELRPVYFDYERTLIELTDEQVQVVHRAHTFPMIIDGPPGSGKTTLARLLLQLNSGQEVLYVTKSARLVNYLKMQLEALGVSLDNIVLKTYDDLISGQSGVSFSEETHFAEWHQSYKKTLGGLSEQALWQEFRILSVYTEDEYCNVEVVGQKQSHIDDVELRRKLYKAYENYLAFIAESGRNISDFYKPDFNENDAHFNLDYQYLFIDEAQDLSLPQIQTLVNINKRLAHRNICFITANGQNLTDDVDKNIYIKKSLANLLVSLNIPKEQVTEILLSIPMRCPKAVMQLASTVDKVRQKLSPSAKQGLRIKLEAIPESEEAYLSQLNWIDLNKNNCDKQIIKINALLNNTPDACVITIESCKEDAVKSFGVSQVFTPSEMKGLQSSLVIIYQPFAHDEFNHINGIISKDNLKNHQQPSYSQPLSELYVTISRSTSRVFFLHQEIKNRNFSNLVGWLKTEINNISTLNKGKQAAVSSYSSLAQQLTYQEPSCIEEGWKKRALSLFINNNDVQAVAILREKLKFDDEKIRRFLAENNLNTGKVKTLASVSTTTVALTPNKAESPHSIQVQKARLRNKQSNEVQPQGKNIVAKKISQCDKDNFLRACENNDIRRVNQYIRKGIDVNLQVDGWYPALMITAFNGYTDLTALLLKNGADVNKENDDKTTALMLAAKNDNEDIVKLLLKHDADTDLAHEECVTALVVAARNNSINTIKLLLKHGADINKEDDDDKSIALMVAAMNGYTAITKILLAHGINVNFQDCNGYTALMLAVKNDDEAIVKLLLDYDTDINKEDADKATALSMAISNNNINMAKILLSRGAAVNLLAEGIKNSATEEMRNALSEYTTQYLVIFKKIYPVLKSEGEKLTYLFKALLQGIDEAIEYTEYKNDTVLKDKLKLGYQDRKKFFPLDQSFTLDQWKIHIKSIEKSSNWFFKLFGRSPEETREDTGPQCTLS